jgi:hypothetical protein
MFREPFALLPESCRFGSCSFGKRWHAIAIPIRQSPRLLTRRHLVDRLLCGVTQHEVIAERRFPSKFAQGQNETVDTTR